jgi:hypothetical protein
MPTKKKTETSTTEHESAGAGGPHRRGANVTIDARAYDELAKTAAKMRWTVPQYLGFVAEHLALEDPNNRIAEIVEMLGAAAGKPEPTPAPAPKKTEEPPAPPVAPTPEAATSVADDLEEALI